MNIFNECRTYSIDDNGAMLIPDVVAGAAESWAEANMATARNSTEKVNCMATMERAQ